MRKLFLIITTLAIFSTGIASAATIVSEIKAVDAKSRTVSLSDGKIYHLPAGVSVEALKVGEKFTVSYDKLGTRLIITKIEPVKK